MLDGLHKYFHINDFICSSQHGLADKENEERRCSFSDFPFLQQARHLPLGLCPCCPLAWKGLPPNSCLSLTSCGPCSSERPSPTAPPKRAAHTPPYFLPRPACLSFKTLSSHYIASSLFCLLPHSIHFKRSGRFVSLFSVKILTSGIVPGK